MPHSYELTKLDPDSFEHLVNMLAIRVLGAGHTGFGPGPDAGRDGFFEGEAPYPSQTDRWKGRWYIQSKFHRPHLSDDPQKWLVQQINDELTEFSKHDTKRVWPDNWIIATNIDPSGTAMTGSFDRAKSAVEKSKPGLEMRFHIWGGAKILQLLTLYPEVAEYYADFLTPGQVLTAIYKHIEDERANVDTILRYLLVRQFNDHLYTKLEQAGSDADTPPGIHRLFIDLPFRTHPSRVEGLALKALVRTAARNHRIDSKQPDTKEWHAWQRVPQRARVWFARGGPGQGKSTIGQYFCQLQRAAFILQEDGPPTTQSVRSIAEEIRQSAMGREFWSLSPRIPITIELKEYAQWFGTRTSETPTPRGILTYLAQKIGAEVEQHVLVGTIKRALEIGRWFAVFDGLDEVPHDVKDKVASEVCHFVNDVIVEKDCDLLTLCTSRPQGYSGQFSTLDGPTVDLVSLTPTQALACAQPLLQFGRTESEAAKSYHILESAIESSSVKELMTTPLQSHIMAIVVRDGGRPPDRRWQLFNNFYQVIRRREANRNLADPKLARLLREDEQLLKTVHNRLGFVLHARAETSQGAQTSLNRKEFEELIRDAVRLMKEGDVDSIVQVLMDATTNRLVLVSTPDDGDSVRFDIRQLQEFFAAEFLYESVDNDELRQRLDILAGDSHWREVVHFLLSAIIENNRKADLAVAVSVLENINEGTGETNDRLFNRRLGRGALLSARILQEGVLEQDKRVRQRFRNAIEPLAGTTVKYLLQDLIEVNQPESREWLISSLIDVLKELNWSENCGAAVVLTHILEDRDSRVDEVSAILEGAPSEYLALLFDDSYPNIFNSKKSKPQWMLQLALKFLMGSRWRALSTNALRVLLRFLGVGQEGIESDVLHFEQLTESETRLLSLLRSTSRQRQKADMDCGFVTLSYHQHDWTTESQSEFIDTNSSLEGIFEVVGQLLQYDSSRRLEDLQAFLETISPHFHLLEVLPSELTALLPIDENLDLETQCLQLRSLTHSEFETMLHTQQLGSRVIPRPMEIVDIRPEASPEQWTCVIENCPLLAADMWSGSLWEDVFNVPRPKAFATVEFVNQLVGKSLQYPDLFRNMTESWGKILEMCPGRGSQIRDALIALPFQPQRIRFFASGAQFYPFTLNLPSEEGLLPHLIVAMCRWLDSYGNRRISIPMEVSDKPDIGKTILGMLPNTTGLEAILERRNQNRTNRAAAMLMWLFCQHSRGITSNAHKQLIDVYYPEIGLWFFDSVGTYLGLVSQIDAAEAKRVLADLLDVSRNRFVGRSRLEEQLGNWRELSQAPMQRSGVQTAWLVGTS